MTEIHYLVGDVTDPQVKRTKIITPICNDIGAWDKEFVLAVSKRWPKPGQAFKQ
jgi:hypothetical protein